jgi:hypothetical protein
MGLTNEEIAADLTWRYVEHLRERAAAGHCEALTPEELAELRRALETAGAACGAVAMQPVSAEMRDRLRARVVAGLPSSSASEPAATSSPQHAPAPARRGVRFAWGGAFAALAGVVIGIGSAVGSVNAWHPTPPPRRVMAARPPDVVPISEQTAHALIPEMVENRLAPGQERNLMWHMLVCRGCFDEYAHLRETHRVEAPRTEEPASSTQIALR